MSLRDLCTGLALGFVMAEALVFVTGAGSGEAIPLGMICGGLGVGVMIWRTR